MGYFHSLAITNNAAVTHSHTSFHVDICYHLPRNEIALGHVVTLGLLFLGTTRQFSEATTHLTFPPVTYEGFDFFTSLLTLVFNSLFDYTPSSGCEVVSCWVLIFASSMTNTVERASFHG